MATSPPLASWRELAADLEAERRRLAFDAERGDEEAARKLEVIEADLAEVRLQIERGEAAQLEAEHRTQIEKAERAAAERSRMERELRRLATQRLKLAKQIDAALDALVGASREVLDLASKMEDLDKALGGPGTNFRAWRALPDALSARLATVSPGHYSLGNRWNRRPWHDQESEALERVTRKAPDAD